MFTFVCLFVFGTKVQKALKNKEDVPTSRGRRGHSDATDRHVNCKHVHYSKKIGVHLDE